MRTALLLALLVPLQAPDDPVVTPTAPIALFNGHDLSNWEADVPARDKDPGLRPSFVIRGGYLVSLGTPEGHLVTKQQYRDYRLESHTALPASPVTAACSCTPRARAPSTRCSRSPSKCR